MVNVALASRDTLARARVDAVKRKEKQRVEGEQAMAEYVAEKQAMREKTARLRALRLARDAAPRRAASCPMS